MNEKKTPRIRFKGFTDDWEQRKLGDIVDLRGRIGFRGYKRTDLVPEGSGAVTFSPADIDDDGHLSLINNTYISFEKYEESPEIKVKEGDILFTKTASIGKIAYVSKLREKSTINPQFALLTPNKSVDGYFLFLSLRTEDCLKYVRDISGGSSIPTMSQEKLKEMKIICPTLKEQQIIGEYYQKLDSLITLHQRKYEKLQIIKKSMLENCFPKNGEKVPRIRFAGFTGDWEQRKLGDLMDVGSVKRVHQTDWRDSGVRFLRARDVVADFNNEEPDDYLYIDQKMYEEYSAQSGKVQQGDLLVTGVGTIGIPMLIKSEKPLYFKDGNIIWFKNKNAIDGQFFYYSFISKGIQDYIKESAGIGTVGTYTIDSGKKTPINLPTSIEEQQEIGIYFKNLDHLITLHQSKLEKLQKIKKSLLERMFA